MKIQIIETATNNVVTIIPVIMGGLDYELSINEIFDEAWRCAVEDGEVNPDKRLDYRFQAVE